MEWGCDRIGEKLKWVMWWMNVSNCGVKWWKKDEDREKINEKWRMSGEGGGWMMGGGGVIGNL